MNVSRHIVKVIIFMMIAMISSIRFQNSVSSSIEIILPLVFTSHGVQARLLLPAYHTHIVDQNSGRKSS